MSDNNVYLKCKDFSVTGEEFNLLKHEEFEILKTSPQPPKEKLGAYYNFENYISHNDNKKSITDILYQHVKNYMLAKKLKWIKKFKSSPGKLLDIGAGTGDFLLKAKNKGWDVDGVEPNEKARSLASQKGISLQEDVSGFESDKYDVITMWHVLEHIPNLKQQILQLQQLLKKDGILIVAVPNYKSYDAHYYKEFWAAYDVPRHLWHFSQSGIRQLFSKHKFKLINSHPLKFDAYYVSILSEKYKTNNNNFTNALFRGYKSNFKAKRNSEYSSIAYFFQKSIN